MPTHSGIRNLATALGRAQPFSCGHLPLQVGGFPLSMPFRCSRIASDGTFIGHLSLSIIFSTECQPQILQNNKPITHESDWDACTRLPLTTRLLVLMSTISPPLLLTGMSKAGGMPMHSTSVISRLHPRCLGQADAQTVHPNLLPRVCQCRQ